MRIEFCEPDILTLFDDWRRAVGVAADAGVKTAPRKPALASHIERVVGRLVAKRTAHSPDFERLVEKALAELDRLSAESRHARGEARAAIVDRLAAMDDELIAAAAAGLDRAASKAIRREAEEELVPFGVRMTGEARTRAADAAYFRLVRESLGLPTIRYE